MKFLYLLLLVLITGNSFGQANGINLGFKNAGIRFGCSEKHTGIRLNIWDKNCGVVNGLNLSINSSLTKINGVSVGLLINDAEIVNGLQLGSIGSVATRINGISIGGIFTGGKVLNGVGIAGLALAADTLNGLFISGMGSTYWNTDSISVINGVSLGFWGGSFTKELNGLTIGIMRNSIGIQNGVSISLFNNATKLHGIQIGLLNFAGNNRKLFQWLPFINLNLRKYRK